jgi:hypothetical protein
MSELIAICGRKFSGKDTSIKMLVEYYGFVHINFADGLRKTMSTALRMPVEDFTNPDKKEIPDPVTGISPRVWLQTAGTDWFRSLWADIWVEYFKAEVARHHRVVCTDLRFPNERAAIADLGGLVIRIKNDITDGVSSLDTHESESYVDQLNPHIILSNNGTKADVQEQMIGVYHAHFS